MPFDTLISSFCRLVSLSILDLGLFARRQVVVPGMERLDRAIPQLLRFPLRLLLQRPRRRRRVLRVGRVEKQLFLPSLDAG